MDSTEATSPGPSAVGVGWARVGVRVGQVLAGALWLSAAWATEPPAAVSPPERAEWEGAIGLLGQFSPTYAGASDNKFSVRPGLFLRWRRLSLTTTGGFVTRRNDDVQRGLAAELVSRERLRVSLSARFDGGRRDDADPVLNGLGNARATVRGRLSVVHEFGDGWRLGAGLAPDLLGRGGGVLADLSLARDWRLSPTLRLQASIGTSAADRRYLQTYFGITEAQSARTGHPVFRPSAGQREAGAGLGLRAELGPQWIGFVQLNASRLLGDARDSPLTRRSAGASLGGGLAWRF